MRYKAIIWVLTVVFAQWAYGSVFGGLATFCEQWLEDGSCDINGDHIVNFRDYPFCVPWGTGYTSCETFAYVEPNELPERFVFPMQANLGYSSTSAGLISNESSNNPSYNCMAHGDGLDGRRVTRKNTVSSCSMQFRASNLYPAWNITDINCVMHIRMYRNLPPFPWTTTSQGVSFGVRLSSWSDGSKDWRSWGYGIGDPTCGNAFCGFGSGWVILSVPLWCGNSFGTFDPTNIRYVAIGPADTAWNDALKDGTANTYSQYFYSIDSIWFTERVDTGAVVIMGDDFRKTWVTPDSNGLTPMALAAEKGIRLVFPIISDKIGGISLGQQLCDTNDMLEALRLGHTFIVHCDVTLAGMPVESQYNYMLQQQGLLVAWAGENDVDIGDGYLWFLFHHNRWDANSIIAAKRVFRGCVGPIQTYNSNTVQYATGNPIPCDPYRLNRMQFTDIFGTTNLTNDIATILSVTAGNHTLAICYLHDVGPSGDLTMAQWDTVLNNIVAQGYRIWTVDEIEEALELEN